MRGMRGSRVVFSGRSVEQVERIMRRSSFWVGFFLVLSEEMMGVFIDMSEMKLVEKGVKMGRKFVGWIPRACRNMNALRERERRQTK